MRRILFLLLALVTASACATDNGAQLVLQDSPLAGFQFHAGKKLWSQMRVGDGLVLVREPENEHDPLAIRVEWHGQHIGYVPQRENHDVARLLDRGVKISARISRLADSRDPWARVRFEVLAPLDAGP